MRRIFFFIVVVVFFSCGKNKPNLPNDDKSLYHDNLIGTYNVLDTAMFYYLNLLIKDTNQQVVDSFYGELGKLIEVTKDGIKATKPADDVGFYNEIKHFVDYCDIVYKSDYKQLKDNYHQNADRTIVFMLVRDKMHDLSKHELRVLQKEQNFLRKYFKMRY